MYRQREREGGRESARSAVFGANADILPSTIGRSIDGRLLDGRSDGRTGGRTDTFEMRDIGSSTD